MYYLIKCKKCNKHSMSTSYNNPKCGYCSSSSVVVEAENIKSKPIGDLVRSKNAAGNKLRIKSFNVAM